MSDKKISELPLIPALNGDEISLLVNGGTDYKFAFSTLLQFISSNLNIGATVSFGTIMPPNINGKNGDLFIRTDTGSFAQKIAGTWTVVYTIPSSSGAADGTILYGIGMPAVSAGNNNDTYINTGTGIFYKKAAGVWTQAFSMQTGPQGPQGIAGTNGTNGSNGFSVLSGTTAPSNVSTGVNGDFYINTSTFTIYGPKAGGVWGTGASLVGAGLPSGGTTGQVLLKSSGNDWDTEWGELSFNFTAINGNPYDNVSLSTILDTKIDKNQDYGLSQENFTSEEKNKLQNLSEHYRGTFINIATLENSHPNASAGDYAFIDIGNGTETKMYIWDESDNIWVSSGGSTTNDATESNSGVIAIATLAEAIGRTNDTKAMTALKTNSLILSEKKNVSYQINPFSITEVSIYMEFSGQVNSVLVSGAENIKLKIGISGTYPTENQTYPFPYTSGDRLFITFKYTDLNNTSCNIKLKCQDA